MEHVCLTGKQEYYSKMSVIENEIRNLEPG